RGADAPRNLRSEPAKRRRYFLSSFFLSFLSSFFSSVFWNLSRFAVAQSPAHELRLKISSEPFRLAQRFELSTSPNVTTYFAVFSFMSNVSVAFGGSRPTSAGFLSSPKSAAVRFLYALTRFWSFVLWNLSSSLNDFEFGFAYSAFQSSAPDFSNVNEPF